MKKICFALTLLLCCGSAFAFGSVAGEKGSGITDGFSRDDRLHVVIDNVYGLMWQDGVNIFQGGWDEARHYCENLNFAGYNDWRLPTRLELLSITDDSRYNPAINKIFKNVESWRYWSSTINARTNPSLEWTVDFKIGFDFTDYIITTPLNFYVRCVRQY